MIEYQEIVIHWSDRISINSLHDYEQSNVETGHVLYQLYGDHPVYGRDTLLYIGQSTHAGNRIKAHLNNVFGRVNNRSVSIGEIRDYNESLEIPESILIANHKPSFNKEFLHDLSSQAKQHKIIVINNGNNGMLKTCCTNYWWVVG